MNTLRIFRETHPSNTIRFTQATPENIKLYNNDPRIIAEVQSLRALVKDLRAQLNSTPTPTPTPTPIIIDCTQLKNDMSKLVDDVQEMLDLLPEEEEEEEPHPYDIYDTVQTDDFKTKYLAMLRAMKKECTPAPQQPIDMTNLKNDMDTLLNTLSKLKRKTRKQKKQKQQKEKPAKHWPKMTKAHYTLRVRREATVAEIKKAYYNMSRIYHPDRGGGDIRRFQEINEAYQLLMN